MTTVTTVTAVTKDAYQQIFTLSMLSNLAARLAGPPAALQQQLANELSAYLGNDEVRAAIGPWSVVWGPAVWQDPDRGSTVIDNAMYVAHRRGVVFPHGVVRDTYVVAVMATNPSSRYAWLQEDFRVFQAVEFAGYDPRGGPPVQGEPTPRKAFVSMGTATGLHHVVHDLIPPAGAPGAGTDIVTFLQGRSDAADATIVFTGHSLAGALAPTLALWLHELGALAPFHTAYVYPTAGATPGNAAYSLAFRVAFPPTRSGDQPWQVWNRLLWNSLDVVPHAWHVSDLSEAKTLYGNAPIKEISAALDAGIVDSLASGMDYTRLPNATLPGTLMTHNPYTGTTLVVPPVTAKDYVAQALGYQHVYAYRDIIGIELPSLDVPLVPGVSHVKPPWEAAAHDPAATIPS
ncbi:MAG: hypothetical protein KDK70_30085 [Myxococcales bacterium]|nr:hypothetical protein [Myxococcales bacterium]